MPLQIISDSNWWLSVDTDIGEILFLVVLTACWTSAYDVMNVPWTNSSPVMVNHRKFPPMRCWCSDISIMYWLTNWVTVGYNEIQSSA